MKPPRRGRRNPDALRNKYLWKRLRGFAILRPMNPAAVYAKHPDYIQRDVAGECILVPVRRSAGAANSIYVLNETGAALWNRLDGRCPLQEIAAAFHEEYDVTADQLRLDVETLVADLLSIHAIEEVAVTDGPTG